jgi:nucleoside-diphosphate-sugar epimerase
MNIAVIGAGYVGRDLAAAWTKKGHKVTVTTRHAERLEDLTRVAQKCILLKSIDPAEIASLILNNDVIVVALSVDFLDEFEESDLQIAHVIRKVALERPLPRRLIYTSTTTIYGDHRGLWVTEESKLKVKSEMGQLFIETERLFLSLEELGWNVCILRLAEIYGPWRELSHRLKSLQGQMLHGSGKDYSNMVHRMDVTAAIDYVLRRKLSGIYNVADDDHPTRKDLYHQIAEKMGIHLTIRWDQDNENWRGGNKRISNRKIKSEGFSFQYPHRIID